MDAGEHALLGAFGSLSLQKLCEVNASNGEWVNVPVLGEAPDGQVGIFERSFKKIDFAKTFLGPGNGEDSTDELTYAKALIYEFFAGALAEDGSGELKEPALLVVGHALNYLDGIPIIASRPKEIRKCEFGPMVALAADFYGRPEDLLSAQKVDRIKGEADKTSYQVLVELILRWRRHDLPDSDARLGYLSLCDPRGDYVTLAKRNYSHFVGHNLLFYLGYHALAVHYAQKIRNLGKIVSSDVSKMSNANEIFNQALVAEAFAQHFLTDMFSSGHARVPRWATIHKISGVAAPDFRVPEHPPHPFEHPAWQVSPEQGNLVAHLLHSLDGEQGVVLTNSYGHVWLAFGDEKLRSHSFPMAQVLNSSSSIEHWEELTSFNFLKFDDAVSAEFSADGITISDHPENGEHPLKQILLEMGAADKPPERSDSPPPDGHNGNIAIILAGSLTYSSLFHVFQNMVGETIQSEDPLLTFIMERLPYAMSSNRLISQKTNLTNFVLEDRSVHAIDKNFDAERFLNNCVFATDGSSGRLGRTNMKAIQETLDHTNFLIKIGTGGEIGRSAAKMISFLYDKHLLPKLVGYEIGQLRLDTLNSARIKSTISGESGWSTTTHPQRLPEDFDVPSNWINAIPDSYRNALSEETGTWGY